jgi:hypothetical protein
MTQKTRRGTAPHGDQPLGIEEISVLEDSRYFVNRAVDALNLQMRRLEENTRNADEFWDYLADVHFYIVALKRLRQAMLMSRKILKIWDKLSSEFDAFDATTTDVLQMRNILEHIDEYMRNYGNNRDIKNATLYTISFDDEGRLDWAERKFDRRKLHDSAEDIVKKYREITSQEFRLCREAAGLEAPHNVAEPTSQSD